MRLSIQIPEKPKKLLTLPMKGSDAEGNVYGVNSHYFTKNQKPILPIMGEFHYSRYPKEEWLESIEKIKAGGITILSTYVFWIHHEEAKGEWDFSGSRDLKAFLELCRGNDMLVWLRIGPWSHGECRNGGFPDWLVNSDFTLREDSAEYLECVKHFYKQIANQAEGMTISDGGPVIGIQIENEYGHCGGPADIKKGKAHMITLKNLAIKLGLKVPYYTATGWGGAYVVDYEFLPVMGGYVDAPWAEHTNEMPESDNFLFTFQKNDKTIGSDLSQNSNDFIHYDTKRNPNLTAELGGGLQVTAHRRTVPFPEDTEAMMVCKLGSGANLIGYYMYHGGINPKGRYSTLQESIATGYNNDLPIKSYDFQACIRENGRPYPSYGKLKKRHLFIKDFQGILAPSVPYLPVILPKSPKDLETIRYSIRHNHEESCGFLFINNHQRKRKFKPLINQTFDITLKQSNNKKEIISIEDITLDSGQCGVYPYNLPVDTPFGQIIVKATNCQLLCILDKKTVFFADSNPYYNFTWENGKIVEDKTKSKIQLYLDNLTLTREQADKAYKFNTNLYITSFSSTLLFESEGDINLLTTDDKEKITIYSSDPSSEALVIEFSNDNPKWLINDVLMNIRFYGDRAEAYHDDELIADWFQNGEDWNLATKRYGYPDKIDIKVYPYKDNVYYDINPKEIYSDWDTYTEKKKLFDVTYKDVRQIEIK